MADDGLAQSSLPVFHPLEARAPPLRGTSISRMEELQQYLRQCDDRQCFKMYFKASWGRSSWLCQGDPVDGFTCRWSVQHP